MLKITAIALGLLSIVSTAAGVQALPNETYRSNQQPAVIRAEDLAKYQSITVKRPVVIQTSRLVKPIRYEGRRYRKVYVKRKHYKIYQHRNHHRKYHGNKYGVMKRYR